MPTSLCILTTFVFEWGCVCQCGGSCGLVSYVLLVICPTPLRHHHQCDDSWFVVECSILLLWSVFVCNDTIGLQNHVHPLYSSLPASQFANIIVIHNTHTIINTSKRRLEM